MNKDFHISTVLCLYCRRNDVYRILGVNVCTVIDELAHEVDLTLGCGEKKRCAAVLRNDNYRECFTCHVTLVLRRHKCIKVTIRSRKEVLVEFFFINRL